MYAISPIVMSQVTNIIEICHGLNVCFFNGKAKISVGAPELVHFTLTDFTTKDISLPSISLLELRLEYFIAQLKKQLSSKLESDVLVLHVSVPINSQFYEIELEFRIAGYEVFFEFILNNQLAGLHGEASFFDMR